MSLCDLIYFCVEIHKQMKIQSYPFHMVIYNSRKHADGLLPILHSNSFCYEYIYLVNVHIFNVFIFLSPVSSLPRASTCRQCHLVPLLSKAHSFSHICQELNFWKCFCRNYWGVKCSYLQIHTTDRNSVHCFYLPAAGNTLVVSQYWLFWQLVEML